MLPLGFGWSLWIHLIVQYPKSLSVLALALGLSIVPVERTGLGTGEESVGRKIVCTVIGDAAAGVCPGDSVKKTR